MEEETTNVEDALQSVESRFTVNEEALNAFVAAAIKRIGAPVRLEDFDYDDGGLNAGLGELFWMAAHEGVIDAPPDFSPIMIEVLPVFSDDVLVLLCAPYATTRVSSRQLDASRFDWDAGTDSLRENIRAVIAAVVDEANQLIGAARGLAGDPADWCAEDEDDAETGDQHLLLATTAC